METDQQRKNGGNIKCRCKLDLPRVNMFEWKVDIEKLFVKSDGCCDYDSEMLEEAIRCLCFLSHHNLECILLWHH